MSPRIGFLALLFAVGMSSVRGQTTDPAKIEDFKKRFQQGANLDNDGKPLEALKVFEDIIAEEPKARGSLFYASLLSIRTEQFAKAISYLDKLIALEPKEYRAVIMLLQANQAMNKDAAVEQWRTRLLELRKEGIKGLSDQDSYIREKVRLKDKDDNLLVVLEYFDNTKKPFWVWEGQVLATDGSLKRQFVLSYDESKGSAAPGAKSSPYLFAELVSKDGKLAQINAYKEESSIPPYSQVRTAMLAAIKTPPKPIAVEPVR